MYLCLFLNTFCSLGPVDCYLLLTESHSLWACSFQLDIEVTPTYVVLGGGALIVLLILSKIISAIDSVPLLPNVLEIIGTGYSVWFVTRYLLFKESRDELFAKFEDLKDMII